MRQFVQLLVEQMPPGAAGAQGAAALDGINVPAGQNAAAPGNARNIQLENR